ncbi:endonuclease/exonuclease/phosphatase family protein [Vibrio kyushuensis]|uniref:endonuclease/exonuclease/phosphatase family protein n=1 Tax=Vibrio TaxID=662 RepID=UPI003D0D9481
MKWFVWLFTLTPIVMWAIFYHSQPRWWLENIFSYPALFVFYYFVLSIVGMIWGDKLSVVSCVGLIIWFYTLTPQHSSQTPYCADDSKINVVQFNLFYSNPDVNAFINEIIRNPADLVVLQEVSPEQGERFYMLDDIYPYRYGGQEGVGYPSSQLILSRQRLSGFSIFHTPDSQNIISGEWQVTPEQSIHLITAHPPSPRNKALWYRRDALIKTIESIVDQYPYPETLIVGDFNLSSQSHLFTTIFQEFETLPLASWPNWNPYFATPAFSMIAIDHAWLKSDTKRWAICARKTMPSLNGSDHLMIRTTIGVQKSQPH